MFIPVNCPQSNGICECTNQTLITSLRCIFNDNNQKVSWPKLLTKIIQQYNYTLHDVTAFSLNQLMLNIKPYDNYMNDQFGLPLETIRKIIFQNNIKHFQYNKKYYDKRHIKYNFK